MSNRRSIKSKQPIPTKTIEKIPDEDISLIPQEVLDTIKTLPANKQDVIMNGFISVSMSFSGPLPHPTLLKQYDEIVDGGAERIFQRMEKQGDHRHKLEEKGLNESFKQSATGQNYGLVIGLAGLGCATILGITGNEVAASIIGGIDILGLVSIFVYGKKNQ